MRCFLFSEQMKTDHKHIKIRLHSSRMHTAHLLSVSPRMHRAGGAWSRECLLQGGPLLGRVCSRGWGGVVPQHALRQTNPPLPREQNSRHTLLKILSCPKLCLRAVIISNKSHFSRIQTTRLQRVRAT